MRKLIYQVWLSLDGYAADADNSTKFFEDKKFAEQSDDDLTESMKNIDTILLGANTYKLFLGFWPTEDAKEEVMAEFINTTPKLVFSKSLKDPSWGTYEPVQLVSEDAVEAIKKLKQKSGKDMVLWGSIALTRSLLKAKLIDELHIRVTPVILGAGTPLFETVQETAVKLVNTKKYDSGLVLLEYKPA